MRTPKTEAMERDFTGGPAVKTSFNARDVGLIPSQGAKITQASRPKKQNIKQKQDCNKFNRLYKWSTLKKKILKKKK